MRWNVSVWALAVAVLAVLASARLASAAEGKDNPIGKPAPTFELQGTDGKTHKLEDYRGKIVVLHFHSIQCPWAIGYQPILAADAREFGPAKEMSDSKRPEVVFLGINSNATESFDQIKADVNKAHLPYVVLKDPHNVIADAYQAATTPHIFIIDQKGILRYRGGIEKAPASPDDVGQSSEQYLKPALAALVAGKDLPVPSSTKAVGCGIKRESKHS